MASKNLFAIHTTLHNISLKRIEKWPPRYEGMRGETVVQICTLYFFDIWIKNDQLARWPHKSWSVAAKLKLCKSNDCKINAILTFAAKLIGNIGCKWNMKCKILKCKTQIAKIMIGCFLLQNWWDTWSAHLAAGLNISIVQNRNCK